MNNQEIINNIKAKLTKDKSVDVPYLKTELEIYQSMKNEEVVYVPETRGEALTQAVSQLGEGKVLSNMVKNNKIFSFNARISWGVICRKCYISNI